MFQHSEISAINWSAPLGFDRRCLFEKNHIGPTEGPSLKENKGDEQRCQEPNPDSCLSTVPDTFVHLLCSSAPAFCSSALFIWNDDQTDAELLAAEGLDRTLIIKDAAAPGGQREQVWRFPSRAECTLCHTMAAKYVLGVTTLQMNKAHNYDGKVANQLSVLEKLGVFQDKLPKPPEELPRLADYRDAKENLHHRARSYLHANCAHCHRKWGGGNAEFELQASIPLTQTLAVNTRPGQGTFKLTDPRILAPGEPNRSLILERMKLEGLGRMPHVASKIVDQQAVNVVRDWIASLSDKALLETPGAIHPRLPTK